MTPLILTVNIVSTQATWFACVLGAAYGRSWIGLLAMVATVVMHVVLVGRDRRVLVLIGAAMGCGLIGDGLLKLSGQVIYPASLGMLPPLWILALWINLAVMLDGCLRWLQRCPWWLVAGIGIVSGPLAYRGGVALDALIFPGSDVIAMAGIAGVYGLALPVLTHLAMPRGPAHA